MGKPNLSPQQQALVDTGNDLSAFALVLVGTVNQADRFFAVENPFNSWLWWLQGWRDLKAKKGVIATKLQQGVYGWVSRKDTLVVHNSPTLWRIGTSISMWIPSGIVLRGKCWYEGREVFRTKLSQSYPPRLTEAFAFLTRVATEMREQATESNLPTPHAEAHHDDGLPWEEASSASSTMSTVSDSDDDSYRVPHGNDLPKDLAPLEHVHLSVLASGRPLQLKIPEQLLQNIMALFCLSPETMEADRAAHAKEIDVFR